MFLLVGPCFIYIVHEDANACTRACGHAIPIPVGDFLLFYCKCSTARGRRLQASKQGSKQCKTALSYEGMLHIHAKDIWGSLETMFLLHSLFT